MVLISNWFITGDTHGDITPRLKHIQTKYPNCVPEETALIVLGDVGFNYYRGRKDVYNKEQANSFGYKIYCLRGNHEERPSNLDIPIKWDADVMGEVHIEKEYPNIRYFTDDGGVYLIGGLMCATVPGAYSVDKFYRLERGLAWFPNEQLSSLERQTLQKKLSGRYFDIVLSHTCPYSWRPTDLFLNCINQSTVDNAMEFWMDELKNTFIWDHWFFGHYHADRLERPNVFQIHENVMPLFTALNIMDSPIGINKSPNYFMGV
jgi:3-oxoacid CoA-transferase subunit A